MTAQRYHATVTALPDGDPQRCEGTAPVVAAFLRAAANQLDPPRDGPGPARGLTTAIRSLPDHRDRKGPGRMGFGTVQATTEGI